MKNKIEWTDPNPIPESHEVEKQIDWAIDVLASILNEWKKVNPALSQLVIMEALCFMFLSAAKGLEVINGVDLDIGMIIDKNMASVEENFQNVMNDKVM